MKYNYKKSVVALTAAVLAAMTVPVSQMPASAWETGTETPFLDWQTGSSVPMVLDTFIAKLNSFGMEKCDFDGNTTKADAYDFYELEDQINALYSESGFVRTVKDDSGNVLTKGNEQSGYPQYDINLDGFATPEDYCILLQYVQRYFDFKLDFGRMCAVITKYTGSGDEDVIVPREIFAKGRIFPVLEISSDAFQGHKELKSITFDDYVQPAWRTNHAAYQLIPTAGTVTACTDLTIGSNVFSGCDNLEAVSLPKHVRFQNTNPFAGAQYLADNFQEINGIRYVYDNTATAFVAVSLTPAKAAAINAQQDSLSFSEKTTAICSTVAAMLDPDALTDVYIPASVEFIEDNAFANFRNLRTVCGKTYADSSAVTKTQVKRYLSAFDNTRFIADAVQPRIYEFVSTIRRNTAEKYGTDHANDTLPLLAETGRLIAEKAEYSDYSEVNRDDRDNPASASNPNRFTNGFDLYPNAAYYVNDLCRGSCNSASAVFLLSDEGEIAYTECVGFAHSSSLILDTLGIRNFFCGAPEHALNIVYTGDKWAVFDMAGRSTWNPDDLNTGNILDGCWGNMSIAHSRQFELFPVSAARQLKSGIPNEFVHPAGAQPKTLTIRHWDNLTAEESAMLSCEHLVCRHAYKPEGWFETGNGSYCYMGADGRLLRSTYVTDENNSAIQYWLDEDGHWFKTVNTAQ